MVVSTLAMVRVDLRSIAVQLWQAKIFSYLNDSCQSTIHIIPHLDWQGYNISCF